MFKLNLIKPLKTHVNNLAGFICYFYSLLMECYVFIGYFFFIDIYYFEEVSVWTSCNTAAEKNLAFNTFFDCIIDV